MSAQPMTAGAIDLVPETWDDLGMRASARHDVILTEVAVPGGGTGGLEPVGGGSGAGRDPVAVAVPSLLLSSLYLGVAQAAISAVQQAVAVVGNLGLSRHLRFQRHLRDAMCSRTHTPQDDMIAADVGRPHARPRHRVIS